MTPETTLGPILGLFVIGGIVAGWCVIVDAHRRMQADRRIRGEQRRRRQQADAREWVRR